MRKVGNAGIVDSLRVGEFRALWSAETISIFGDQLARVALAVLVFDRTSSAALTALTYALTFAPALIGGFLLSGLADKYSRKKVIVVTDLLRTSLAAAMAIPGVPLAALWGLIGALTMAAAPFKAAQLALLPQILSGDRYQAGLAVRQISIQVAQVAGFGFGGLLVVALTPSGALLIDAGTFLVSALVAASCVRARPAAIDRRDDAVPETSAARLDLRLAAPFALGALIGLFVVPEGLAAPYASAVGMGTIGVGLLMAADPVGSVVGAWWAAQTRATAPLVPRSVILPAVVAGIPLAACAVAGGIALPIVLWAVSGVFSTIYLIRLQPMIVAIVPDERRGAVMGRFSTCVSASQGLAILAGGVVAERTGPVYAVVAAGLLGVVLALCVGALWKLARPRQASTTEDEPDATSRLQRNQSDFLVTHDGLLPEHPATGRADDPGATSSRGSEALHGNGSGFSMQGVTPAPLHGTPRSPTGWSVWSHSGLARALILAVELAAFGATVASTFAVRAGWHDLVICAVIVACGLVAAELARQVERRRRHFSDTPHVNFSSVWTVASALVLPPALTAFVTVVLYAHLWIRCSRGVAGGYLSRFVFNASNVILPAAITAWAARQLRVVPMHLEFSGAWDAARFVALLIALIVIYFAVNSAIAAALIAIVRPDHTAKQLLGPLSENILEVATLCMGVVTALLLSWYAVFIVLIFVPLYALHRSVLIRQLEHAAMSDPKTGLLNATAWRSLAEAELARARRDGSTVGILMIDLDHFRRINNLLGHLVGDKALCAVAKILRESVPGSDDRCGRFGGEEFVVVLPGVDHHELEGIANRICNDISQAQVEGLAPAHRLSASIGAVLYPSVGPTLEDALFAADIAMFAAKDAGRGQVRLKGAPTS